GLAGDGATRFARAAVAAAGVGPDQPRAAIGTDCDAEVVEEDAVRAPTGSGRCCPTEDPGGADVSEIDSADCVLCVGDPVLRDREPTIERLRHVDVPHCGRRRRRWFLERADSLAR